MERMKIFQQKKLPLKLSEYVPWHYPTEIILEWIYDAPASMARCWQKTLLVQKIYESKNVVGSFFNEPVIFNQTHLVPLPCFL